MRNLQARLNALEAQQSERPQPGETRTSFAYGGERRTLQTDDTGRVVFAYDDVIAALAANG